MSQLLVDTGPLVAAWSAREPALREWARDLFSQATPPLLTCEACLTEAAHLLGKPGLLARMVAVGDLVVPFRFQEQAPEVLALLSQYKGRMDFADACMVRLSELFPNLKLTTVDNDFRFYRRFQNEPIPVLIPERNPRI